MVSFGTVTDLSAEVVAAYDAPLPDDTSTAGAVLSQWSKPFLTLFSDQDPITKGSDRWFRENVSGAAGQPHRTLEGGGHFLQEDLGPELAGLVADFVLAP